MARPRDVAAGPGPLPAALQPWHRWLQWFGPELAAQLGTLVQRLHPLLGRFQGRLQGGEPEPDGLGDLHPRGPYERLLATEWLLADDLPDEFMRRAAMGEHLFLAPRPRGRQAERLIVALFDAGPLQLGAPRLAHLALWILLARRALGAGGELRWGLLQMPGPLHEAGGAQHLQQLLHGRSFVPGDASHWARWSEVLVAQVAPLAECWLIGADLLAQDAGRPTHQVRVRRSLGGDALDLVLRERRGERSMQLPLPATPAAAALLRGTSGGLARHSLHQHHAQRLSLQRRPLFSPHGDLVAVPLLGQHGVSVFPVPRAQDREPGMPRHQQWSAGAEPLALCFGGKQVAGVLGDATHLFFWHVRGLDAQPRPPREQFHAPPGGAAWLPSAWLRQGGAQRLCVLDASARLVTWQVVGQVDPTALDNPSESVLGLAQYHDGGLVYVRRFGEKMHLCRLLAKGEWSMRLLDHGGPADARVWFAGGVAWESGLGGCAVRMRAEPSEHWRVHQPPEPGDGTSDLPAFHTYKSVTRALARAGPPPAGVKREFYAYPYLQPHHTYTLDLPAGWRALGLVRNLPAGGYALVIQSPDRMKLYRMDQRDQELLYTAPSRVLKCSVCPNTGRVAMLTAQRQLIVYDTRTRAVHLFVHTATVEHEHAQA